MKAPLIETEGQAASWYHSQILRIEHGKRVHTKRYLTGEQVLEVFDGDVVVEEKIDGKLSSGNMNNYQVGYKEVWIKENLHPVNSVHPHIKYSGKRVGDTIHRPPASVWLDRVIVVSGEPHIEPMLYGSNALRYGTIRMSEPNLEEIYMLLNSFSKLSSHYGAIKIEGLVLKNYKKQLFAKWINEEFEDKIKESERKT